MDKTIKILTIFSVLLSVTAFAYTTTRDSKQDNKLEMEKLDSKFKEIDIELSKKVSIEQDLKTIAKYEQEQNRLRITTSELNKTLAVLNETIKNISETLKPVGAEINTIENRTINNSARISRVEQDINQIRKRR